MKSVNIYGTVINRLRSCAAQVAYFFLVLGLTMLYLLDAKADASIDNEIYSRRKIDYNFKHNLYFTLGYESSFITGFSDGKLDAIVEDVPAGPNHNYANHKIKFKGSNEFKLSLGLDLITFDSSKYYKDNNGNETRTKTVKDKMSIALEIGYNYSTLNPHNVLHNSVMAYDRDINDSKSGIISAHDVSLELLFRYKLIESLKFVLQLGGGYIFYDLNSISNSVGDIGKPSIQNTVKKLNTPYMSTNIGFEFDLFEGDGSIKNVFLRIMGEFKYLMKADYSYIITGKDDLGTSVYNYVGGRFNLNSMGVSASVGIKF